MTITCVIRYEIDPFQRDEFKKVRRELGTHHSPMRWPSCRGIFFRMKARTMWRGV